MYHSCFKALNKPDTHGIKSAGLLFLFAQGFALAHDFDTLPEVSGFLYDIMNVAYMI